MPPLPAGLSSDANDADRSDPVVDTELPAFLVAPAILSPALFRADSRRVSGIHPTHPLGEARHSWKHGDSVIPPNCSAIPGSLLKSACPYSARPVPMRGGQTRVTDPGK